MKFILGTKQKMTQVWNDDGRLFPATIISAGPVEVVQVKSEEKDGYTAIKVGYGSKNEKNGRLVPRSDAQRFPHPTARDVQFRNHWPLAR